MRKSRIKLSDILVLLVIIIMMAPLLLTLTGSLMSSKEYSRAYLHNHLQVAVLTPRQATLSQYSQLLFNSSGFLLAFWNSLFVASAICILQLAFCIPCAYGLSKLRFKGRNTVLFLVVALMLMPFQVTMLPMFQIVKALGLFDTRFALIVPEVFSPLIIFILTQFIHHIPDECIESVRMESSSAFVIYQNLVWPLARPGIISAVILSFSETWGMVEKPLLYLSNVQTYPLSMSLSEAGKQLSHTTMAGSVLYVLPVMLLWWLFQDELLQGIGSLQVK